MLLSLRLLLVQFLRSLLPVLLSVLASGPAAAAQPELKVGSKRFTESYLVGEIVTATAARAGPARHLQGLGNTAILYQALRQGSIDVYPEYTGTIAAELLKLPAGSADPQTLDRLLAEQGLGIAVPLGFANSYGLATRGEGAGLPVDLSALASRPALRLGLSHEFIGRADGWPALRERYRLPQTPIALDHGLAYEALRAGQVDVIDVYTTDAQIARQRLVVLRDDQRFFPAYDAVLLHRLDAPARHPQAWAAISRLQGRIDEATMRRLNERAELDREPFAQVAERFMAGQFDGSASPVAAAGTGAVADATGFWQRLFAPDFMRLAAEHLALVAGSVLIASLLGVPLGVIAAARPRLRQLVMSLAGIAQTIPSLALLAMLIPLVGRIGALPALIALVVYALLPIVRNTCVGIGAVPEGMRSAARALGLDPWQQLRLIELPLAAPVMLAGIKTAAVVAVGTATIAAFIGAGGFGERISIGLALNDHAMLLAGAVPAALLALLTQWGFDLAEYAMNRRRLASATRGP